MPLLQKTVNALAGALGENLHSVCLYGSSVRGGEIPGRSDINLLLVLQTSDAKAHEAIAAVLATEPLIEPFILGLSGFQRSVRAFAAKFASIKRFYQVLYGADPLAEIQIAPQLEKFLCEQSLRNLRLRLARAFVTRSRHHSYPEFLARSVTPILLRLSEILRLSGLEHPTEFPARIPILSRELGLEPPTLEELLRLKAAPMEFKEKDAFGLHDRVFTLLNTAIVWIETHWSNQLG